MNILKPFIALMCALSLAMTSFASSANNNSDIEFSQGELEQILAPIALYPDSLLTHILISSTYPLEIVQAQRWLTHHKNYNTNEIADAVENKEWDASVKALMAFPRVIKRLNDDLDWTQNLGDAFLQDEQQVLASIQILRRKADQAGNLDQMDNMDVVRDNKTIIIKSVQPDVVYVPYYDSRYVYGDWYWYNYPPVYWNISFSNRHFYRSYNSPFYWHRSGVTISFNYFFNAFHWHDRRVVVVDHYRPHRRTSYSYGYKINHHKTRVWQHNPVHRRGVAYHNHVVKKRYLKNGARVSVSHKSHNKVTRSNKHTYVTTNKVKVSARGNKHSTPNVVVRKHVKTVKTPRNMNKKRAVTTVTRTKTVTKTTRPNVNKKRVVTTNTRVVKSVNKHNSQQAQRKYVNSSSNKVRAHSSIKSRDSSSRGHHSNKERRHQQRY